MVLTSIRAFVQADRGLWQRGVHISNALKILAARKERSSRHGFG